MLRYYRSPLLLLVLFGLGSSAFKGEWCDGCNEKKPVSKIAINTRIENVLSGFRACTIILPPRTWTKYMLTYNSIGDRTPFKVAMAERFSWQYSLSTASFHCRVSDPDNSPSWTIGPYEVKCPWNHWLVIVKYLRDPEGLRITPGHYSGFETPFFCVKKRFAIKQEVLPRQRDCLDVPSGWGFPIALIAWATTDEEFMSEEVYAQYFTFTQRGDSLDPNKPPPEVRGDLRTALFVPSIQIKGTKLMFCYQSKAWQTETVLRVGPIYAL